jgi:hypothetical protein
VFPARLQLIYIYIYIYASIHKSLYELLCGVIALWNSLSVCGVWESWDPPSLWDNPLGLWCLGDPASLAAFANESSDIDLWQHPYLFIHIYVGGGSERLPPLKFGSISFSASFLFLKARRRTAISNTKKTQKQFSTTSEEELTNFTRVPRESRAQQRPEYR